MTLSERNLFFKIGIAFCSVLTLLLLAASFLTVPAYPDIAENSRRPVYLFQFISGLFLGSEYYAVHASLVLAVLFSLVGTILIYSYFERTSAPEILYIFIFTASFSLEVVRLVLPVHIIHTFPLFYLLGYSRVLLFARFFGIFSLFTASLCASGLEVQKTRNIIIFMNIAVLLVVITAPIDSLTWDTSFVMANGYNSLFKSIEIVTFLATVLSFFMAARVRESGDYIHVGIGVLLALTGRNILLGTDNWAGPVIGILLLSFGTWFICSRLHKIHLWL